MIDCPRDAYCYLTRVQHNTGIGFAISGSKLLQRMGV